MKKITLFLLIALVASVLATTGFAASAPANEMITADGYGAGPTNAKSPAQTVALARRAAMLDAFRNLTETVKGVNIDSNTTVEDAMVTSDKIATSVTNTLKDFRVIKEESLKDGSYHVQIGIMLQGPGSLSQAVGVILDQTEIAN